MAMAQSTSVEIRNEFWTAKGIIKDLSSTSVEIRNEFWTSDLSTVRIIYISRNSK